MSSSHAFIVDATGSLVFKNKDKEIFYFAFISYDRLIKTEPVAHIELLSDLSSTHTIKFVIDRFLENEMQKYNYSSFSVHLLCVTDFSWPIIKSFNNETLEDYLHNSFLILTGKATVDILPKNKRKTFDHISLCHVMKAFTKKVDKCFKRESKTFIKFIMSLLVNSSTLSQVFERLDNIFKLLSARFKKDSIEAETYLEV